MNATRNRGDAAAEKARYWREHIEACGRSGLTQREYCERFGLALSTFQLWRRRLVDAQVAEPCLDIVPFFQAPRAALLPHPLALVVDGGRYRLEIADGVRVETLHVVLEALESRR